MSAEKRFWHFFHYRNGWNWFDFIIVACSLIPLEDSSYVLLGRLLRLFRVMRLISFIPQLRLLTTALIKALPRMAYVAVMMFVIFYMYAALGSLLFERIDPELWGDIGTAMLTLFRVATFEDWTDVMYATMKIYPLSWIFLHYLYFPCFFHLSQYDDWHYHQRTGKRAATAKQQSQRTIPRADSKYARTATTTATTTRNPNKKNVVKTLPASLEFTS